MRVAVLQYLFFFSFFLFVVMASSSSVADEATRKWCAKAGEGWAKAEKISAGWKQLSSFACGYVPIEMWLSPQGVHVLIAQEHLFIYHRTSS
jgi:hypothetical protein